MQSQGGADVVRDRHTKQTVLKSAKTAGILAACAVWLSFVIYCWNHNSFSLPDVPWAERLIHGLTGSTGSLKIYLCQSGFVLLAFYLTVLVPDLLHRFAPENRRLRPVVRAVSAALLLFGALCSFAGCLTPNLAPIRWLKSVLGSGFLQLLRVINLWLIPVALCLTVVTWFLPAAIQFLTARMRAKTLTLKSFGRSAVFYGLLAVLAFLITCTSAVLLSILKPFSPDAVSFVHSFVTANATWSTLFFVSVVMAPLMEEAVFRGLIQHHTGRMLPAWFALLFASVCFGLWHRNLGQFVYTFSDGLLWGLVYGATGKIRHTIVLHGLNNLFSVMAASTSRRMVLGKLTVCPAVYDFLRGLSPFPAVLVFAALLFMILLLLELLLRQTDGRERFLLRGIRRLTGRAGGKRTKPDSL